MTTPATSKFRRAAVALAASVLVLTLAHLASRSRVPADGRSQVEAEQLAPPRETNRHAGHREASSDEARPRPGRESAIDAIFTVALELHKENVDARLAPLLSVLRAEDFPRLARMLATVPEDLEPWRIWTLVMRAWGTLDGQAAFTFAMGHDIARAAALDAMHAWITARPEAPVHWLESIPNGDERAFLSKYYIGVWLQHDYRRAMKITEALADPTMRSTAYRQLVRTTVDIGDPRRRDEVAAWLLERSADPAVVAGASFLATEWVLADPAQAVRFALSLPAGGTRQTVFKDLISQWAGVDPHAAGTLLDQPHQTPEWEAGVAAYALLVAHDQPATARDWASTITDPTLRQSTQERLARIPASKRNARP